MSEPNEFCPNCGTNLEPDAAACPACGALPNGTMPKGTLLDSLKRNTFAWIGGVVVLAGVAAFVVFGGLLGPSGKMVCTATLNQARDFGAIAPSAVLDSTSAKSTDVKNRKSCTAKVGEDSYTLTVDLKNEDTEHKRCRDYVKQSGCVALYSVARSDGVTTYQVREIPPNETDEALAKEGALGIPPGQQNGAAQNAAAPDEAAQNTVPGADQGAGGGETETSVENAGPTQQGAPAQQDAQPQQSQQ